MKKIRIVGIASVILVVGIVAIDFNNNRIEHINDQLANNPPAAGDGRTFGDIERARSRINDTTAGFHTTPASLSVYKEIEGNVTSFSDIPTRNYSASTGRGEIIQVNASNPPTKPKPDVNQQVKHSKWESQFAMFPQDQDGWSIIEPAKDSRLIYVSDSAGNNRNAKVYSSKEISDPHNPPKDVRAYKTIGEALKHQRNGHADWVLLKKGDEWTSGTWYLNSGRSSSEPLVVTSYGEHDKRPLINTGTNSAIVLKGGKSFIAIAGIEFYAKDRDPNLDASKFVGWNKVESPSGFNSVVGWNQKSQSITLEDNVFRFYGGAIVFSGSSSQRDIVVRRNQLLNSYSTSSHSQGIFAYKTSMILEQNLIDHNGWYQQNYEKLNSRAKGQATWFNHNVYMSSAIDTIITGNIISRSSSIGIKLAASGDTKTKKNSVAAENIEILNNLFVEGEIGISAGGNKDYNDDYRFKDITIKDNVMLHIGDSQPLRRTFSMGIQTVDWDGGKIINNYLLYNDNAKLDNIHGIDISGLTRNVLVNNNVLKDLGGPEKIIMYKDEPIINLDINNNIISNNVKKGLRHDLTSYFNTSGSGNAVSTLVEKSKTQSKSSWSKAYTAGEVNKYLMD